MENITQHLKKEKEILIGKLPARAEKMVIEFLEKYEEELLIMWENGTYKKLKGLE